MRNHQNFQKKFFDTPLNGVVAKFSPGFTLAELIVVITILAVLATVGLVALQGYSKDAAESASKTNVRSVYSAIAAESAITGMSARHYIVHDSNYALSGSAIVAYDGFAAPLVPGNWNAPGTNYSAGTPDWQKLKINPDKFRISSSDFRTAIFLQTAFSARTSSILVGAAEVSSADGRAKSYVQAAAVLADSRAFVSGNYATSNPASVTGLLKDFANPSSTGALLDGMPTGSPPECSASTVSGYSLPVLESGKSVSVTKPLLNGSASATAFCSFGTATISGESTSCSPGFVPSGISCIADVCGSTVPVNATSTATSQSISGTWHNSSTAGQCTFACNSGYSWDGNSCRAQCSVPISETWSGQTFAISPNGTLIHGQALSASAVAAFGSSPKNGVLTATAGYSCNDGALTRTFLPNSGACQTNYEWNSDWSSPSCAPTPGSVLVGRWDMQTICSAGSCGVGNDGRLKDFSPYGNHGVCMDAGIANACGTVGKGPQVSGTTMVFNSGADTEIIAGTGGISVSRPLTVFVKAKFFTFSNQNGLVFINNSTCNRYLFSSTWTPDAKFDGFHAGTCNASGVWGNATNENVTYFAPNVWYVISYVIDPMSGRIRVYRDNALIQSFDFAPYSSFSGVPMNVWIGGNNESSAYTTNGQFEEVRIYNEALTNIQLTTVYNEVK